MSQMTPVKNVDELTDSHYSAMAEKIQNTIIELQLLVKSSKNIINLNVLSERNKQNYRNDFFTNRNTGNAEKEDRQQQSPTEIDQFFNELDEIEKSFPIKTKRIKSTMKPPLSNRLLVKQKTMNTIIDESRMSIASDLTLICGTEPKDQSQLATNDQSLLSSANVTEEMIKEFEQRAIPENNLPKLIEADERMFKTFEKNAQEMKILFDELKKILNSKVQLLADDESCFIDKQFRYSLYQLAQILQANNFIQENSQLYTKNRIDNVTFPLHECVTELLEKIESNK